MRAPRMIEMEIAEEERKAQVEADRLTRRELGQIVAKVGMSQVLEMLAVILACEVD